MPKFPTPRARVALINNRVAKTKIAPRAFSIISLKSIFLFPPPLDYKPRAAQVQVRREQPKLITELYFYPKHARE